MKSETAEQVVKAIDPLIHIHAFVDPIQPSTEHIYHDSFFEQLDAVLDATDSIVTRKFLLVDPS